MARVFRCGPGSAYGCQHHDEHVRAAKLGWLRRHLSGTAYASADEERWLSRVTGEVQHAHTHPEHPDIIAFKQRRKWYELPRSEFKALVRAGREAEREEVQEAKRRAAEARQLARWQAELDRADEIDRHRAQQSAAREQRYRAAQERQVRAVQRAERAEVVKTIKAAGGIRLVQSRATGKTYDRGEYQLLPADVRRKNGRLTIDQARESVMEEMPWLNLETPDDLVQFFERSRVVRAQQTAQRKRAG